MTLLIDNEIKNAKAGKKAYIYLKLNNITDSEIINQLYEASQAGVTIRMIVRGMFSIVTGIKNVSDNIKAIGIVDRFLEHTRFMIFCNGGNEECYISSADLMTRNIEHRIEVTCPVFDKSIRNELKEIFEIQWSDNVKARKLDPALSNKFVKSDKKCVRSQREVYDYLLKTSGKSPEK
jgi:polyphosphate kinase